LFECQCHICQLISLQIIIFHYLFQFLLSIERIVEICSDRWLKESLRILWFNWRDIKNPEAGGAEVFTHEIMSRLASMGYTISLFTVEFENCNKFEEINNMTIIRDGGKYSVYSKARSYYKSHKDEFDVVIDEINTKPFLTPKFVKDKPILAVIHQLAREFWFYETRFPLNYLGYHYLESKWLSYYRNIPTITVSNSTKQDLTMMGFKNILIVPEGLSIAPLPQVRQKGDSPVVAFLGRLKKAKLPDRAIEAFNLIKQEINSAQMWVIGDGYMRKELENSHNKDVVFHGHVKDELKYELLSRAHVILVPGIREGWGLNVTESNAMGTPAVVYNIPGLRDSVKDGETGLIVKENSPSGLANSTIFLLKNPDILTKISNNALSLSKQFSWDKSAHEFDKIIKNLIKSK
jgi:glycosyltransferase involved in cell wall biosynthesis